MSILLKITLPLAIPSMMEMNENKTAFKRLSCFFVVFEEVSFLVWQSKGDIYCPVLTLILISRQSTGTNL